MSEAEAAHFGFTFDAPHYACRIIEAAELSKDRTGFQASLAPEGIRYVIGPQNSQNPADRQEPIGCPTEICTVQQIRKECCSVRRHSVRVEAIASRPFTEVGRQWKEGGFVAFVTALV